MSRILAFIQITLLFLGVLANLGWGDYEALLPWNLKNSH
jgi:hypothetical protein